MLETVIILSRRRGPKTVGRGFHKREGIGDNVRYQCYSDALQVFTVSSLAVLTDFLSPGGKKFEEFQMTLHITK